jgi:hypothetical protein
MDSLRFGVADKYLGEFAGTAFQKEKQFKQKRFT